jgi:hypothetical protein
MLEPLEDTGGWIGLTSETNGIQATGYLRSFSIRTFERVNLVISCNSNYSLYLDGNLISTSSDLRSFQSYSLSGITWTYGSVLALQGSRFLLPFSFFSLAPFLHFFLKACSVFFAGMGPTTWGCSIELRDNNDKLIRTAGRWKCSTAFIPNWNEPTFDDSAWANATLLGLNDPSFTAPFPFIHEMDPTTERFWSASKSTRPFFFCLSFLVLTFLLF